MKVFIAIAVLAFAGLACADLKADLIVRGNDLIRRADVEIRRLQAERKTSEVTILRGEEAQVRLLVTELEAAISTVRVAELERELQAAESRLSRELARLNAPVAKRDVKSSLIAKGAELIRQADAEIRKLEAERKTAEVVLIRSEEAVVRRLVAELETASPARLSEIERELGAAEAKLAKELARAA